MRSLLLFAFFLAVSASAQPAPDSTAHRVPFASTGNTLELAVANTGADDALDGVTVRLTHRPEWLTVSPEAAMDTLGCPPYDESALRHLRLILTEEDFHDFVLEAGAESVDPDSLVTVTDTLACAALDSALVAISAQADPAYYEYARYDRAFFEGDGLYFAVEWPKPSEDPWQVVGGPSYFRAFGPDFVMRARESL